MVATVSQQERDACPTTLRVGPYQYEIIWDETDRHNDYGERGYHNQNNLHIVIAPNLPRSLMAVAFIHEVIHAIWRWYFPHVEKLNHEQVAEMMSTGLTNVWMDNPDVFSWWQELIGVD